MSDPISYEAYLETHGSLTYTHVGCSMLPLLRQGRDLFTVRKKEAERCRKGDVVLYRRSPDQYILHRIVKVRPEDYVLLGDNNVAREYGIRDADILGVMTAFVRDGKEHSVTEPGYRLYSFIWVNFADLRIFLKKAKGKLARLVKRS